jgi:tRNA-dihydrouridine synthase B
MIGRGALGRPWLFTQLNHFLETGKELPDPPYQERIETCIHHYDLMLKCIGIRAVKEMRKHIGWYLKGMPNSHRIRQELFSLSEQDDVKTCLRNYGEYLAGEGEINLMQIER